MKLSFVLALLVVSLSASAQEKPSMDAADLAVQVLTEGTSVLDPNDILAWVNLPRSVKKGDPLTLTISVENARAVGDFNLESVDLDGSFLEGFRIESVTPMPAEADDSFGSLTLEFPMRISAGETLDFVLELIAVKAGVYIGEVSIWDKEDFLSRYVQCRVVE